jgi:hypothetical protein
LFPADVDEVLICAEDVSLFLERLVQRVRMLPIWKYNTTVPHEFAVDGTRASGRGVKLWSDWLANETAR